MSILNFLGRVEILALLIPIVGVLVWGVVSIVTRILRHQERMAMIERGMHPDQEKPENFETDH